MTLKSRSTPLLAQLAVAFVGLAAVPASRADAGLTGDVSRWGLGLGVGLDRKAYRGIGTETRALPLLYHESRWISLRGTSLDLKLPSAGPVSFRVRARYAGDGYEAEDSPFLAGMQERKAGFWVGGAADWRTELADFSGELLGDASGHSKGLRLRLGVERRWRYGAIDVTPRLAVQWMDDSFVNYYYGVNPSEVLASRPVYHGRRTVNVEVGLRVGHAVSLRQSVFLDLNATALGEGIKDSPLVDRARQTGLRLGYLYRF